MIMRIFVIMLLCAVLPPGNPVYAQNLSLEADDLRIEQRADDGFHLFIRKKPGISSALLTESTRDPAMGSDSYAYRAREWNPVNGDEIRVLNGVPISRESRVFSLVSSTVEAHPELGEAFHIFVPWIVDYGYENSRHGEVVMAEGTYLNIRAFSLPYADYRGDFLDNPFVLHGVQKAPEKPPGNFDEEAEREFNEIARQGKGDFVFASDPVEMIDLIESFLLEETGRSVDIVICMDTTGSMGKYIEGVKKMLIPMMKETIAGFTDYRIGMVLFRDYPPNVYLTRIIPFTRDFALFQKNLGPISASGGGDVPEAVYEALYEGADKFPWAAESRLLVLIGDAPPHPAPRGKVTREMVYAMAEEKRIRINAIILAR